MDKRARERDKDKGLPPSKRKAKGKLVEGQITTDWNKALAQPRHRLPRPNQPLPVKRLHRKLDADDGAGACVAVTRNLTDTLARPGAGGDVLSLICPVPQTPPQARVVHDLIGA